MALTTLETNIVLDVYDHDGTRPSIKSIALDDNTRYVFARLTYQGNTYDIGSTASVKLVIIRPDKVGAQVAGEAKEIQIGQEDESIITIYGAYAELDQPAIAVAGTLLGQFIITSGNQILRSQIFAVNNGEALDADEWAGQYDGYNLDELVEKVDDMEADVTELKSGLSRYNVIDLLNNGNKESRTISGITFTWNSDGSCTVSGTATASALCQIYSDTNNFPAWLEKGKSYRIIFSSSKISLKVWFYKNGSYSIGLSITNNRTVTIPNDAQGLVIRLQVEKNVTVNETVHPQILSTFTNKELSKLVSSIGYDDVEVITDFTFETGYIGKFGVIGSSGNHTNLFPVQPNKTYYLNHYTDDTVGAFYDVNGEFCELLMKSQITTISDVLHSFTTPLEARYMRLNVGDTRKYRVSVCSKPCIFVTGSGTYAIVAKDKSVSKYNDKKLCCIGDSITYIDRTIENNNVNHGNLLCGWQEYVGLLFDSYTNYGFSGGTWGQYDNGATSIYDGVVTAGLDLSGFDAFILLGGYNGMGTTDYEMGEIGTYNQNTSPTTSQLGGLRGVIDYIYSQNPNAKIFLCTNFHTSGYYTWGAYRTRLATYRQAVLDLGTMLGIQVIDLEMDAGFTLHNYQSLTYDGLHPNNDGMRLIGEAVRKAVMI